MTLLWHDSLDYRSSAYLSARYAIATGLTLTGAHPQSGRKSLQVSGTSGTLQFVVAPSTDTCNLGLLVAISAIPSVPGSFQFLHVRSPGGTTQVRVDAFAVGSKTAFRFYQGNGTYLLHQTSPVDLSTARYLEFTVKVSVTGSVALRVDGVEDSRADFVNTEAVAGVGWGTVTITPSATGVGSYTRISDLYVNDSKLLGPVVGSLLRPSKVSGEWSPSHLFGGKYNLIILCGQSNQNGRTLSTGPWRVESRKLKIWDNRVLPATFEFLSAGDNTYGFFLPTPRQRYTGPEMQFAERIASWFESVGENALTNVRMMKMCQDASMLPVFPGNPQYSWNPSQVGSLYNLTIAEINAAVTSLGGWSAIHSIDFFFFQGETEALTWDGPPIYGQLNKELFEAYQTALPVTVNFTRVMIHEDLSSVHVAKEGIRIAQTNPGIPGRIIQIDEPKLFDGIHITAEGQDILGDKYFEIWKETHLKASYVRDYEDLSALDTNYFSGSSGKGVDLALGSPLNMTHGPVRAATARLHVEGVSPDSLQPSVAKSALPAISVGSVPQWTAYKASVEGSMLPDTVVASGLRFTIL